ncbi:MAG: hypothetical protein IT458_09360 [Planctomycetes bacterium]|nr:hypothetical protein [Planctomycetota bacterium]
MPTSPVGRATVRAWSLALVLASLATAGDEPRWRTDLAAARQQAANEHRMLVVAIHEAGEPGNEAMVADVYRQQRFADAARGAICVLVCRCGDQDHARVASLFPGVRAADIEAAHRAAIRSFVAPGREVPTPQLLVLHPDGGVLWHRVRYTALKECVDGFAGARRQIAAKAAELQAGVVTRAKELARSATRSLEDRSRLVTLLAHAPAETFAAAVAAIGTARGPLEEMAADALAILPVAEAQARVRLLRDARNVPIAAALREAVAARAAAERAHAAAPPFVPRPWRGTLPDLSTARFDDGVPRTLDEGKGAPTLLIFLLPDDPTLPRQLAAWRAAIPRLTERGVRCLALAPTLDPESALAKVSALDLPCPRGVYRNTTGAEFFGLKEFPAVVILGRDLAVRHCDGEDPDAFRHGYARFVDYVLGL